MRQITATVLLMFGLCLTADADIWKWVDDEGVVHYGDMPAREYANSAELVRSSSPYRPAARPSDSRTSSNPDNDTRSEEQVAAENAQSYYCERAKDIYRSYVDAPRLYRTGEDGQREYLSDEEVAATIANAEASVAEWCQ